MQPYIYLLTLQRSKSLTIDKFHELQSKQAVVVAMIQQQIYLRKQPPIS